MLVMVRGASTATGITGMTGGIALPCLVVGVAVTLVTGFRVAALAVLIFIGLIPILLARAVDPAAWQQGFQWNLRGPKRPFWAFPR